MRADSSLQDHSDCCREGRSRQGNSSREVSKEAVAITQQRDQSHLGLDGGDAGCEPWRDFKSNRIVHRSDMSYGKKRGVRDD